MPNTHRRRDSTVELRRIGGVNRTRNDCRRIRIRRQLFLTTWVLIDIDNFFNNEDIIVPCHQPGMGQLQL